MPCYQPSDAEIRAGQRTDERVEEVRQSVQKEMGFLESRNSQYQSGLCAIITELEKRGIAHEILPEASRKGLIDLMQFWDYHKKDDESRLARDFHERYSTHEQELLKKIINKEIKSKLQKEEKPIHIPHIP